MDTANSRYDRVSIFLHWTIGIGIIVVGLTELLRGEIFARGSAPREILKALHEPTAFLIFVLILARLVWRSTHTPPAMPAGMQAWETMAAKLTHVALYGLMIVVPLLGLAVTSARGRPIDFGLFKLAMPAAFAASKETARAIKEVHEAAALTLLGIAGLHAAAALWHHHVRRDDVLTRMLPRSENAPG